MITKIIWDKLYFHPLFYIIATISLLTAKITNLIYFTIIIFIHELGHSITGIILNMKLKRIEIYPYGGCSKLEYDINIPLYKELLVLIMGPLIQIIFTYLIYYLKIDVKECFFTYSKIILIFNLIPIYPLDGGKIINIILSYIISFYKSLKYTNIISYLIYISIVIILIINKIKYLYFYLIIISLGLDLYKEINNSYLIFKKFILERYLNNYNFKKKKYINNLIKMKKDYYHYFIINNSIIEEKDYLKKIFTST